MRFICTGDDRAFVTRRSRPAVPHDLSELIASGVYDHLPIGKLATLTETPHVLARAKAAGMTVSVDCAWDAVVLARKDLVQLLAGVDVLLPRRIEADALLRHAPLAAHAPLVVVKNGEHGAEAMSQSSHFHRPAVPVQVVETVGAGGAFNAGFWDRWLDGAGLPECLEAGTKVASTAFGRQGGARGLGRLARDRTAAE